MEILQRLGAVQLPFDLVLCSLKSSSKQIPLRLLQISTEFTPQGYLLLEGPSFSIILRVNLFITANEVSLVDQVSTLVGDTP